MMSREELVNNASYAMQKSYAPFSNVKIGAAVLTDKNKCYTGYNLEFGPKFNVSNAERMAIKEAFDNKDKVVKEIVIVSNNDDFPYPSGVSRQMIYELATNATITLINGKGEERNHTIFDLLPFPSKMLKQDD